MKQELKLKITFDDETITAEDLFELLNDYKKIEDIVEWEEITDNGC